MDNALSVPQHPESPLTKKKRPGIPCKFADRGCDWSGHSHGLLRSHLCYECKYVYVPCCNMSRGCTVTAILRSEAPTHYATCRYAETTCSLCKERLISKDLPFHERNLCLEALIDCPNDGCNKKIKRRDVRHHIEAECAETEVTCSFAINGCCAKVKRKDMEQHNQTHAGHHIDLLQQSLARVSRDSERLILLQTSLDKKCKELQQSSEQIRQLVASKGDLTRRVNTLENDMRMLTDLLRQEKKVKTIYFTGIAALLERSVGAQTPVRSPEFKALGRKFHLTFYPNGYRAEDSGWTSLFLTLAPFPRQMSCHGISFSFTFLNQIAPARSIKFGPEKNVTITKDWGFYRCLPRSSLLEEDHRSTEDDDDDDDNNNNNDNDESSRGFVVHDTLAIRVSIKGNTPALTNSYFAGFNLVW